MQNKHMLYHMDDVLEIEKGHGISFPEFQFFIKITLNSSRIMVSRSVRQINAYQSLE